ncbi:MAG: hypothetical protein JST30_12285 [Armatimonadetes bacterium]|nr:hypothetical protein [Armatimonadota bacterium]
MRAFVFSLALASLAAGAGAQVATGWNKVRVDVPDAATLRRLSDSDLNTADCILHLGQADVIVGPQDWSKLSGFRYSYAGPLEDPRDWQQRHGWDFGVAVDDYRLHYYNHDQILAFFENLRLQNPKFVVRKQIGTSINGQAMWAYRFGLPVEIPGKPKTSFVVHGLIHAREWISGSVMMHLAKSTLDGLKSSPMTFMVNQNLWIIPITNPDGYKYTWTNDRYWRKNRRNNGGGTFGVDLNRNYAKGWGGNDGSSGNKGSETYRGTAAFSEPETQAVRDFAASLPKVGAFIDFHSFSQLILWPWSYTTTRPADQTMFNNYGLEMETAMSAFGRNYDQGQCSWILYTASGTSNDYIYSQYNVPAYAIELRDTGQFGFELPEDQIQATQDEAWAGYVKLLNHMAH